MNVERYVVKLEQDGRVLGMRRLDGTYFNSQEKADLMYGETVVIFDSGYRLMDIQSDIDGYLAAVEFGAYTHG